MKYLLDTHVWIWAMNDPNSLPENVRAELFKRKNFPFGLSAISAWEVSRKESLGKLRLSVPIRQWFDLAARAPFIQLQSLSVDVAHESNHLPGDFHRDPADQIIVATARVCRLTIITADRRILSYSHVNSFWG